MKRLLAPLSIVNQVALLMLLSGILGVAGMGISAWMSQSIQGNAHAINKAGSLRMQSYRLLAQVPLDERHEALIRELERDENSPDLQRSVEQEGLTQPFDALRDYWQQTLQPRLRSAQRRPTPRRRWRTSCSCWISWCRISTGKPSAAC